MIKNIIVYYENVSILLNLQGKQDGMNFPFRYLTKYLMKYFSKKTGIYSGYHGVAPALGYGGYGGYGYAAPAVAHAAYAPALARPAYLGRPAVAAAVPGTLLGK